MSAEPAAEVTPATPYALQRDPAWLGLLPFHEYLHGDTGVGLGVGSRA